MNDNLFSILFIAGLIIFFVIGSFVAKLFRLGSDLKYPKKKRH